MEAGPIALIDLRNATVNIKDGGSNTLEVKIGQGNLTYTEKRDIDDVKSRGKLDTNREGEDQPMEVAFSFVWEFLKSASGEPVTVEDALKKINGASTWTSASSDPLAPYCVHLEIVHTPPCLGTDIETILLPMFNYLQLAQSLADATVACNGKCNAREATITRTPQS